MLAQVTTFLNSITYNDGLNEKDRGEALSQRREGGLEKLTEEMEGVITEIVVANQSSLRIPPIGHSRQLEKREKEEAGGGEK